MSRLCATEVQRRLKVGTLPVKLIPARSGELVIDWPKTGPSDVTKLITPGGRPQSLRTLNRIYVDRTVMSDGFHTTTLPIRAGAVARLPPIAVKLKGEIAATKPSRPR